MSFPGPPAPSRVQRMLQPAWSALVDLVYPRLCCVCHVPLGDAASRWFCRGCEEALPLVEPPYCEVCGEVYDGAFTNEFRCANCSGRRLEFEFAVAACRAEEGARELIHQFKYERRLQLRGALAALMLRTLEEPRLARENLAEWLLVPVPLHRTRELDREFNQSWELCLRLSQLTGIPATKALVRVRATDTQASLDRDERLRNLRGAFSLLKSRPWRPRIDLHGRRILLVDDVFTTGATTSECARVLRREGGAEKVVVITAARG
ncbi:ComF family protein [Prosthecobacter sp.]|uniref:ComF family protein n=1 Tax=Prosthecobacter sp. TaxID=1965333 RepID=UPI001DC4B771|nr:ComF family protein [Prosthecobacter sp.]MCB1275178.1 ComF family protein [Prosthecobacter sp.]